MDLLNDAVQLAAAGRYGQALRAFPEARRGTDWALFHAELLERTGNYNRSRAMTESVLQTTGLSATNRATCESILGLIALQDGDADRAMAHLQRASGLFEANGLAENACWSRLRFLLLLSDRSGPDAILTHLPELRSRVMRTGNAHLLAALHIFVGQMEGKRGLLSNAQRHCVLGQEILSGSPNVWLEATAQYTQTAVFIMMADFDQARLHGQRARALAEESGVLSTRIATLANLGHLHYRLGDFHFAANYLDEAIRLSAIGSDLANAARETLAQLFLAQSKAADASRVLNEIDAARQSTQDEIRFVHRHSQLTRALLFSRQEDWQSALVCADQADRLAKKSGDVLLSQAAQTLKAGLFAETGRIEEMLATLEGIIPALASGSPELYAKYEQGLALGLAITNRMTSAEIHFRRAERIFECLGSAPELGELRRRQHKAMSAAQETRLSPGSIDPLPAQVFQSVSALMLHSRNPLLLAHELLNLISVMGCVESASVFSRTGPENTRGLAQPASDDGPSDRDIHGSRVVPVGTANGELIEIVIQPKRDIESRATLNAVALLLSTLKEIERGRAEREDRLTLWPVEDVPIQNVGQAVVNGRIRETMDLARRVASTNAGVLITGESGTGKEILARAIHTFSQHADKPIIPFNCAAVPREMLESQLFGHRRGAFTGADRDNPGVIRAARGGTLFLDEIGELALELQPKLLRFLESNEIFPLGETTPIIVDVRVIAATNANLEQLVKIGRFREDLFYRLNIVPLRIPPLRERRDEIPALVHHFVMRAATDYRKGQIRVAENTMEQLLLFGWPGNVRQLQNELRRMVALAEHDAVLTPHALSPEIASVRAETPSSASAAPSRLEKLSPALARIEKEMIKAALREYHGKMDATAKALGISRKGLYLKRQRLGL